mmetsp:Transcript_47631/g.124797  ORF Transcript_47631/g.124797 Transcript_47631/m.124797 type:complete len:296 (-) Transcript_47631:432-1319(-)
MEDVWRARGGVRPRGHAADRAAAGASRCGARRWFDPLGCHSSPILRVLPLSHRLVRVHAKVAQFAIHDVRVRRHGGSALRQHRRPPAALGVRDAWLFPLYACHGAALLRQLLHDGSLRGNDARRYGQSEQPQEAAGCTLSTEVGRDGAHPQRPRRYLCRIAGQSQARRCAFGRRGRECLCRGHRLWYRLISLHLRDARAQAGTHSLRHICDCGDHYAPRTHPSLAPHVLGDICDARAHRTALRGPGRPGHHDLHATHALARLVSCARRNLDHGWIRPGELCIVQGLPGSAARQRV